MAKTLTKFFVEVIIGCLIGVLGFGPALAIQNPSMRSNAAGGSGGALTFSQVNEADSGPGVGGSVASVTTGAFNVTAGNLIYCAVKGNSQGSSLTFTDASSNTWTTYVVNSSIAHFQLSYGYFVASGSNASETAKATSATNSFLEIQCNQFHRTSGSWTVDANPTFNQSSASTTPTSTAFSTVNAAELIISSTGSFGGITYTAGNACGNAVTGSNVIGTNGSTADMMTEWYFASAPCSSATTTFALSASDPWDTNAVTFK